MSGLRMLEGTRRVFVADKIELELSICAKQEEEDKHIFCLRSYLFFISFSHFHFSPSEQQQQSRDSRVVQKIYANCEFCAHSSVDDNL